MRAAQLPIQRHPDARLMVVDAGGGVAHVRSSLIASALRSGDLLVANDAATLPASLAGRHAQTGRAVEIRLAGSSRHVLGGVCDFFAVAFGDGDFRTRTEDRPPPPVFEPGDRLELGPLTASVSRVLAHPRLIDLHFQGSPDSIREGLARHGRPIQYAHISTPLALWDSWTAIAAVPAAFEPPSAGFLLSWQALADIAARGVGFTTLTHAAGISSTGDAALDALLPFDEAYRIPPSTAERIRRTRRKRGRIVAVGTTVVRALEHAASVRDGEVAAGEGVANQRIGADTSLRVVDVLVSGTHERGSSHYELLRAFASDEMLERITDELEAKDYRTHEFGDWVLLERTIDRADGTARRRCCDAVAA